MTTGTTGVVGSVGLVGSTGVTGVVGSVGLVGSEGSVGLVGSTTGVVGLAIIQSHSAMFPHSFSVLERQARLAPVVYYLIADCLKISFKSQWSLTTTSAVVSNHLHVSSPQSVSVFFSKQPARFAGYGNFGLTTQN